MSMHWTPPSEELKEVRNLAVKKATKTEPYNSNNGWGFGGLG